MKHTCAAVNSNEVWLCSSETSNTLNLDMIGQDKSKSCVSININAQTTTPRASLKSPHIQGNMVSINDDEMGDTLIIIGGRHLMTGDDPKPTDQVEFCDQKCVSGNGDWETLPSLPEKLYNGQVTVNTKSKAIYHFGGQGVFQIHHTWGSFPRVPPGVPLPTFTKTVYSLEFGPLKLVNGKSSINRWRSWVDVGELQGSRCQGQVVFDIRSEVFWLVGGTDGHVGGSFDGQLGPGIEKWSEDTKTGEVIASDESFHRRQFSLILMEN